MTDQVADAHVVVGVVIFDVAAAAASAAIQLEDLCVISSSNANQIFIRMTKRMEHETMKEDFK